MDDFRDQYNDQFSENNWAQHIICHIDIFKSSLSNIQRVLKMGIKRDPLKAVITFLKNKFSEKYPKAAEYLNFKLNPTKMEMIDQIFNFVYYSVPHNCLKCSQSYVPFTQPSFEDAASCFLCKIPSHTECCTSDKVDQELGVVFLCQHCINIDTSRLREDPTTPKKVPSSPEESPIQPAQPQKRPSASNSSSSESLHTPIFPSVSSASDSSEDEKQKQKRKTKKKKQEKSETGSDSSLAPTNAKSKDKKEKIKNNDKKLCRFYERGICRYGVSGKRNGKCNFHHPPMCKRILQHGPKSPHGCKGDCEKWHPKLCYSSIRSNECFKESCSYWHIKRTIRSKNEENKENNVNEQAPTQNKNNETPFLGEVQSHVTQMLNQQQSLFKKEMLQMAQCMNLMHRQIQMLVTPANPTTLPQIPIVQTPQVHHANVLTHQPRVVMNNQP